MSSLLSFISHSGQFDGQAGRGWSDVGLVEIMMNNGRRLQGIEKRWAKKRRERWIVGVIERHMGKEGELEKEIEGRVIHRWRRIRRFKEVRDKGMARDKHMDL